MNQPTSGYFNKLTAGAGLVLAVVLIAVVIWQFQGDDETEPVTPGAGQNVASDSPLPGFPTPGTRPSTSGASESASVKDSADLDIEEGASAPAEDLATGSGVSLGDSVTLQSTGSEPVSTVGDGANVGDSAETVVQQALPPPPPSGPSEVALFADTADLVIRDSEGNIKTQETVK